MPKEFDYDKPVNAKNVLELLGVCPNAQHLRRNLRNWAESKMPKAQKPEAAAETEGNDERGGGFFRRS